MKKLIYLSALALGLFSCSKDDSTAENTQPDQQDQIILAGSYNNIATYWMDNQKTSYGGSNSVTNKIIWHNNLLAGCGKQFDPFYNITRGSYFQNASANGLQPYSCGDISNTEHSNAYSIFSTGTDYYVAGTDGQRITFWKNGYIKTNITDNSVSGFGRDIYISNNILYLVGWRGTIGKAMLWEYNLSTNTLTNTTNLSDTNTGVATCIEKVNSDIYIGGSESNNAVYWKNGVKTNLTNISGADGIDKKAIVQKIVVINNDIYAVGNIKETATQKNTACIWKNGTLTKLTDGTKESSAYDIKIKGSNVYVVGDELGSDNKYIGKVWKNGVATNYAETGKDISFRSLIVK